MVIIVPKSGSHLTQCTRLLCSSFRRCSVKNTYAPAPRTQVYSHLEQVSHMSSVIGKFITYPENDFSLFIEPFLKVESTEELRTFGDLSLLIREPALSVIKDLINIRTLQKNSFNEEPGSSNSVLLARYSAPRFVLHGQPGTGISTTLGQITCFSGNNKWLIFPFVSCEDLLEPSTDIAPSNDYHLNQHHDSSGDTLDFPARSAEWLKFFLKINRALLEEVIIILLGLFLFFFLFLICYCSFTKRLNHEPRFYRSIKSLASTSPLSMDTIFDLSNGIDESLQMYLKNMESPLWYTQNNQ
ncbi:Mitochondrial 28S ribosomal protein S29 [Schistosoma japonicum]|nr:Mitochondrial 28S ribosomal protein S29 [Schistosoma japonicum]